MCVEVDLSRLGEKLDMETGQREKSKITSGISRAIASSLPVIDFRIGMPHITAHGE